jgi:hypothetical protein
MSLKSGFSTLRLSFERPGIHRELPHQTHPLARRELGQVDPVSIFPERHDPHSNILALLHDRSLCSDDGP